MELMETDDPVKSRLLKQTSKYREDLEGEAKEISEKTEKMITNALIIGGSLALTYFVYKQFSGGSSKSKKKTKVKKIKFVQPNTEEEEEVEEAPTGASAVVSQIGTALASQAGAFLLSLAKEKLSEYLQSQSQKKADEHS